MTFLTPPKEGILCGFASLREKAWVIEIKKPRTHIVHSWQIFKSGSWCLETFTFAKKTARNYPKRFVFFSLTPFGIWDFLIWNFYSKLISRPNPLSSCTSTLNDSGTPARGMLSPFTMAS